MHRAILEACLPCALALAGSFCLLYALLQLSGAKCDWSRLGRIHRCESGAVQSLAFVLTFPLLLAVLMLMVQVSQLMIAQMTIHYAAFAGARAASVWLPAVIDDPSQELNDLAEVENRISDLPTKTDGEFTDYEITSSNSSDKLWKVRAAVVQAMMPLCPSRNVGAKGTMAFLPNLAAANQQVYATLHLDPRVSCHLEFSAVGPADEGLERDDFHPLRIHKVL